MWFMDSTGKLRRALVDSSGHIQVDVLTSPLSALIGEVQASPTTYTVLDRLKTLATLLAAGLPAALDTGALKIREQSPLTEIDVDIAKILNAAVSLTNYLPVGVVYPAGTLIDPRSIRTLTILDIVTAKQSTASDLKVEIVQPAVKETFHVDTSGGTNIIVDKLLQGAFTENRVTLTNQGVRLTWPSAESPYYIGKYFPRGARGIITYVNIYCYDAGSSGGTFTVYFSPKPTMAPLTSATITVAAGGAEANRGVALYYPWDYDSIFVYVRGSSADLKFGSDIGTPYDAHYSLDNGATWTTADNRYHIYVLIAGGTVGDVPTAGAVSLSDRSTYLYSNATADKQVKASPGRIHTVTINKCTTAGTLTIYDSTAESGTVIATIALALNMVPVTLLYDVLAQTGIYLGFDASLVADVTVSYL